MKTTQEFTYGLTLRPASHATVPSGYAKFGAHKDFHHGTVAYTYPLPSTDVEHFSLVHIPTADQRFAALDKIADRIAEQVDDYLQEYLDEEWAEDPKSFVQTVGQSIDQLGIYLDRDVIAQEIINRLQAKING